MPLYVLGLLGMTRRMQHYDVPQWRPWLLLAAGIGMLAVIGGMICQIIQLYVSIRRRTELRDETGDPWDGRNTGMGDILAAARLQLCRAAARQRRGSLLGHQAARPGTGGTARGAGVRAHRDAAQQPYRLRLRVLRHLDGLRADLAHLVDGRARHRSAPRPPSSCSPGATCPNTSSRPKKSPASTGQTAKRPQRGAGNSCGGRGR